MKVKICGIRSYEDALSAIEAGADMLGFNFYPPSPRYLAPQDCRELVLRLKTQHAVLNVTLVGVFVNEEPEVIRSIVQACGLDLIQLSGDEPPEVVEALGERAFKALRPSSVEELERSVRRYPRRAVAPAWLVDSSQPGAFGGTGRVGDWSIASRLARNAAILLAGGLRPENVGAAIEQVKPWGVDVASGVESAPGVKDPRKVRAFLQAVRSYTQEPA